MPPSKHPRVVARACKQLVRSLAFKGLGRNIGRSARACCEDSPPVSATEGCASSIGAGLCLPVQIAPIMDPEKPKPDPTCT